MAKMRLVVRGVLKMTTASTEESPRRTSARSASEWTGRSGPLRVRTDSSPLRATMRASPRARAWAR